MKTKLFSLFVVFALLLGSVGMVVSAAPPVDGEPDLAGRIDNRPDPLTTKQVELKGEGLGGQAQRQGLWPNPRSRPWSIR